MSPRGQASLWSLLREQMSFIRASAEAYDRGFEAEAKRIATAIRILVHDTRQSPSLLTQLGIKERLRWKDTALETVDANLAPTNGLAVVRFAAGGNQSASAQYVPPLGTFAVTRASPPASFERWWTKKVTKDGNGNLFSRRDFVLTIANKEGGAHVDPSLDDAYRQLVEENSLGIRVFEGPPESADRLLAGRAADGNAALASVRQVAFEVIQTIDNQAMFLVFPPGSLERPVSALAPDSLCPCGSGVATRMCHLATGEGALELGNTMLAERPQDAASAYAAAVEAGQPEARFNLGLALHGAGDYEGAEAAFIAAMHEGHKEAASNLGVLRAERDDENGARQAWEEAHRLGSTNGGLNLAKLLERTGSPGRALAAFEKVFEAGSHEAGLQAARLLRTSGDVARAREIYRDLAARGDERGAFNLAMLDYESGDLQSARQRLERLSKSRSAEIVNRVAAMLRQIAT